MRGSYSSNGLDRRRRSQILGLVGFVLFAVLIGRLFVLQILASERSRELAKRNWLKPEYVTGPRGRILDRDGNVLAEMVPSFVISIDPQNEALLQDPDLMDRTLVALSRLVAGDAGRYRELVEAQKRRTYKPVRLERNANESMVARVEEHRASLPGVAVEVEPVRRYPMGSLAAHVLGYIGEPREGELEALAEKGYHLGSLIGKTGLELEYEEQLRGEDGIRFVEVNALGRKSEAFNREQPVPPRPGRDIVLSLDSRIQKVSEAALDAAGYEGEGEPPEVRGAAILMDVWTGEILAMASRPGFDVNLFSRSISVDEWQNLTRESRPLLNRAVQAAYPPGSVFKPLTEYAGLSEGVIAPGQKLNPCVGGHRFGNRVFRCWKRGGHGQLDDVDALAQSCDVYFYQIAPTLGVDGIARYGRLFRMDEATGVDLPQERESLIPDGNYFDERYGKKKWSPGVSLNLIIGQGEIQLTPIHLVQFTGILATGGRRMTPRLVKALGEERRTGRYPRAAVEPFFHEIALDPVALGRVRAGMERAVVSGTAGNAAVVGRSVAGKTGTAENPGFDHALFIAYAPSEKPEVAVAVLLENRGHGGSVAAPVARRILASYFGVPDSLDAAILETD
jgi:penicillin-binding protein 2